MAEQIDDGINSKKKIASRPIIILGILSMIGFVICAVSDLSYYMGIETYIIDGVEDGNPAKELYEQNIEQWENKGVDVSVTGLKHVSRLFLILGIMNVPVLLGVALMFYRVKMGFKIYTVCQLAYILIPIYFLGFGFYPTFRVLGYGDLLIMVLFVFMWGIQRKHMDRKSTSK